MKLPQKRRFSWKSLLPSSGVSLFVHACVLIVASMSLRGCEKGVPVQAGGQDFREVGIALVHDRSDADTKVAEQNPQESTEERPSDIAPETLPEAALPTESPSVAELLSTASQPTTQPARATTNNNIPDTIGPGEPISGLPSAGMPPQIRPKGISGQGNAGSPTPGPGETQFMNIVDGGTSFVYVVDTSSSMADGQRMELAKSQLKGSLQMLQPNQKFQILFYNEATTQMKLRLRAPQDLYAATTVHIQLASDEIDRVQPTAGTEHLSPILHALRLEPEVIYFLTDGDQPRLSTTGPNSDLEKIRRANRTGARIHVIKIESGGRESREVSWLELLAHQSGGKFQYVMVK